MSKTKKHTDIKNDALKPDELRALIVKALATGFEFCHSNPAVYLWHAGGPLSSVTVDAFAELDLVLHRQVIWKKPQLVLGRSGMYHWIHEPCFYGWRRGNEPHWFGDRAQTTVWEAGEPTRGRLHPTAKPIDLFLRPIENHTRPGACVYEPFSGSGSQLIACERAGRACRAIELEPKYVAVALERWAMLTGLTPRLSGAG